MANTVIFNLGFLIIYAVNA